MDDSQIRQQDNIMKKKRNSVEEIFQLKKNIANIIAKTKHNSQERIRDIIYHINNENPLLKVSTGNLSSTEIMISLVSKPYKVTTINSKENLKYFMLEIRDGKHSF